MNDTMYIKNKKKWQASRLINDDGVLKTEYRGLWETEEEAKQAPTPISYVERIKLRRKK